MPMCRFAAVRVEQIALSIFQIANPEMNITTHISLRLGDENLTLGEERGKPMKRGKKEYTGAPSS